MNRHTGSTLDDYLTEEGILDEVSAKPTNGYWCCNRLTSWKSPR
ncbi:MAG TPA: hypothetical protein VN956_15035 [Pyrinomonadaceae bacterium]|nr:hypothetical protein [Pyrinomonadaceae bacterium]